MSKKDKPTYYKRLKKAVLFKLAAAALTIALVTGPSITVFAGPAKPVHTTHKPTPRIPNYYSALRPNLIQASNSFGQPLPIRAIEFSDPLVPGHLIWYARDNSQQPDDEFFIEGEMNDRRLGNNFRITTHDSKLDTDYVYDISVEENGKTKLYDGYTIMSDIKLPIVDDSLIETAKRRLCGFLAYIKKGAAPQQSPQQDRVEYVDLPSNPILNPFFDGTRYARLVTRDKQSRSLRVTTYSIKGDIFCMRTATAGEPSFVFKSSLTGHQELSEDIKNLEKAISESPEWEASFNDLWLEKQKYGLKTEKEPLEDLFPETEGKAPLTEKDIPKERRQAYWKIKATHDKAKLTTIKTLIEKIIIELNRAHSISTYTDKPTKDHLKVNRPQKKTPLKRTFTQRVPEEVIQAPKPAPPPAPTKQTSPTKNPKEDPLARYKRLMLQNNQPK
ncbi:MAG: hypothetical protein AB7S81_05405 [Bdellovibrionales bacterium]